MYNTELENGMLSRKELILIVMNNFYKGTNPETTKQKSAVP